MKKTTIGILLFLSALLCVIAAGCEGKPKVLEAPKNFRVENNVLIWDEVEHASGYAIYFNEWEKEQEIGENSFDFSYLERYGVPFEVEVLALGDGVDFLDSDWVSYTCVLTEPFDPTYGLSYKLTEDGTGYIVAAPLYGKPLTGGDSDYYIYIPDEYEGLPVKEIGSLGNSAKRKTALTVRMPETVEKIGDYAFVGFSSLMKINIPESVTSIGKSAFDGCSMLTEIALPEGLVSIEEKTFEGCSMLTQIELPEGLISIGEEAFYNCASLKQFTLSEGLISIGQKAFGNCISLVTFSLPSTLETIEYAAFGGCKSLRYVDLPQGLTTINGFNDCVKLNNVRLPSTLKTIGITAFSGCTSLTSIDCSSCSEIGYDAFWGCSALSDIKFPEDPNSYAPSTFATTLWYKNQPDGYVIVNGDTLFHYKGEIPNGGVIDSFPSHIKKIAGRAFGPPLDRIMTMTEGSNIVSIEIPDGVQLCGPNIFYRCNDLKHVKLPNGITEIPESTFDGCHALESIEIPEGVTKIGKYAFNLCSLSAGIKFPSTLETIELGAFHATRCTKFYLPDNLKTAALLAFSSTVFKEIILPLSLDKISKFSFTDDTIVYYRGTEEQWNERFSETDYRGTRYYYSETPPSENGNYWHFDSDGVTPVIWSYNE